jgi:hypothetical protein
MFTFILLMSLSLIQCANVLKPDSALLTLRVAGIINTSDSLSINERDPSDRASTAFSDELLSLILRY